MANEARSVGSEYTPEQRAKFRELVKMMNAERTATDAVLFGAETPAGQMEALKDLTMLLADAKPRSLWQRLRGAWDGMVAGWRGEAWWQE